MKKVSIFLVFLISACGGGGNKEKQIINTNQNNESQISVSGLISNGLSFESQNIKISSSNNNCNFLIENDDLIHLYSSDSKYFSFKNPIVYEGSKDFVIDISTITSEDCQLKTKSIPLRVTKNPTKYEAIPENKVNLKTNFFQVNDIGFGGIVITDRYSATICYPTPNDCMSYEDELFGQDAHNITFGDFNNDGYEDFAIAWALFPHTIEKSKKVNAPINIYLNNQHGSFIEDLDIYSTGSPPTHPFAYRILAKDLNNDGYDDIFAGSMGLQYRSQDYSENYIDPYPHLLLISNGKGELTESSANIIDDNNGEGMLCGFAHDASAGDPDGDGDIDIYACNILLVNDGNAHFTIHPFLNLSWQQSNNYTNPMSSLVVDLNNDGFDELIFWNMDNRTNWQDTNEGYILLSNNSSEIQDWEKVILPAGPFGQNKNKYNHAASGDFNNDGFVDVVVAITRGLPNYYEGAYIQILINNTKGVLIDETSARFPLHHQVRAGKHHGEGNIYVRDMNNDGFLDIIHSTRDWQSPHNGAHIIMNDGYGNFISVPDSDLPNRPFNGGWNQPDVLMKGMPIDIDKSACLDLISVTDSGFSNSDDTRNYLFSLINLKCID
jgi:hypothetical protein